MEIHAVDKRSNYPTFLLEVLFIILLSGLMYLLIPIAAIFPPIILVIQYLRFNNKNLAIDGNKVIFPYKKSRPNLPNTFGYIFVNKGVRMPYYCFEKTNIKSIEIKRAKERKSKGIVRTNSYVSNYHWQKGKNAICITFKKPLTWKKSMIWIGASYMAQELDHICFTVESPEKVIQLLKGEIK